MLLSLSGEPLEQTANVTDQRRLRAVLVDDTFAEVAGTLTLSAQLRPYRPFGCITTGAVKCEALQRSRRQVCIATPLLERNAPGWEKF